MECLEEGDYQAKSFLVLWKFKEEAGDAGSSETFQNTREDTTAGLGHLCCPGLVDQLPHTFANCCQPLPVND